MGNWNICGRKRKYSLNSSNEDLLKNFKLPLKFTILTKSIWIFNISQKNIYLDIDFFGIAKMKTPI